MLYRNFKDIQISAIGMVNRGTLAGGNTAQEPAVLNSEMLYDHAIQLGVNYFEISQGYGRKNPLAEAGRILQKYPRESLYLASGFPGYQLKNFGKQEQLFLKQLEDLQTDYLDFYLLDCVTEFNIDSYLGASIGTTEFFIEQKKAGRIRYLGCSFFGNQDAMRRFLEQYGEHIDFCQFALNWLDWDYHMAKQKVRLCWQHHIPIWADEPLKNGLLEHLPQEKEEILKDIIGGGTAAALAYRYLKSVPEVATALLEMPEPAQLEEAIEAVELGEATTEEENQVLYKVAESMRPRKYLDCIGCRRCMQHCIKHLDIAGFMELQNEELISGFNLNTPMYIYAYPTERQPQSCCHWGPCQSVCPTKLDIIRMMLALGTRVRRNPYYHR